MSYINGSLGKTVVLGNAVGRYNTSNSYLYASPLTIGVGGVIAPGGIGYAGVYSNTQNVSLTNNGSITGGSSSGETNGPAGIGVNLSGAGATLINSATGHITGGVGNYGALPGWGAYVYKGTLTNSGVIKGGYVQNGARAGGTGVELNGGSLTNNSGGSAIIGGSSIGKNGGSGNGGIGVYLLGGATAKNSGKIVGGSAQAVGGVGVKLTGGSSLTNSNVIDGGQGHFAGGAAVLATGSTILNTSSGKIVGASSYSGGSATQGGVGAQLNTGAVLTNNGSVIGGAGYNGAGAAGVSLNGGTLINAGTVTGGTGNSAAGAAVQFGQLGGTLDVSAGAVFNGVIAGFSQKNDTVDLTNISLSQFQSGQYFNSGTDTVTTRHDGTLLFSGDSGFTFLFTADASGTGTDITVQPACYRRGTHIATPQGETPVETLRIGDEVLSISGAARTIRWIGRRTYSREFTAGNRELLPVLIRAGALSDGVPQRDLWVSPNHALFIDGMLIPAWDLINGDSIVQDFAAGDVAYFHLEFDSHDIILAEGAPAESYVDDESRGQFDNAAEFTLLYPDAAREPALFCAPRVEEGEELESVRRRLAARAVALEVASSVAQLEAAPTVPPRTLESGPSVRVSL